MVVWTSSRPPKEASVTDRKPSVAADLAVIGEHREDIRVSLSKEIITLLSEQMYQSPAKAIEELVVNSSHSKAMRLMP